MGVNTTDTFYLLNKDKILIEFTEPDILGEYKIKDYDK